MGCQRRCVVFSYHLPFQRVNRIDSVGLIGLGRRLRPLLSVVWVLIFWRKAGLPRTLSLVSRRAWGVGVSNSLARALTFPCCWLTLSVYGSNFLGTCLDASLCI